MSKSVPIEHPSTQQNAFCPGHTLCPGCAQAMLLHALGRATDNGRKTIFTLGTFCGEVSTLRYPGTIAWGRGDEEPDCAEKTVGVIHNAIESAPSMAEGIRDAATALEELGAWSSLSPNVVAVSSDRGALSHGLRALLSTVNRRARVAIFVLLSDGLGDFGFRQSSSTSARGSISGGLCLGPEPVDHLGLALAAGAGYVAQASTAFPSFFKEVVTEALDGSETAVVFVPAPCIVGWGIEENLVSALGKLAAETGLFPCFRKRKGQLGEIEHLPPKESRPKVQDFLALQRRFDHLARTANGEARIVPGRESEIAAIQEWADRNAEHLKRLAQL
jgi:pyruvate ferredoxin oxidoreductase beta subunit